MNENSIQKKRPSYLSLYINKELTATIDNRIKDLQELKIMPPNTTRTKFIRHAIAHYLASFSEQNMAALKGYDDLQRKYGISNSAKDLYTELKIDTNKAIWNKLEQRLTRLLEQNKLAPTIDKAFRLRNGDN